MAHHSEKLRALLDEYGESHRHPANRVIHKICVPAIMLSLLGLCDAIPTPVSVAYAVVALGLIYYAPFRNITVYAVLLGQVVPMMALIILTREILLWPFWLGIFAVAWVGQFIGHALEGRKPSFLKDVFFLLVGPVWILRRFVRP